MSFKKLFIATSIALSSSLAMANGVSYDYVQGSVQDYDNFDGVEFDGSMSFNQNWYGRAEVLKGETDHFDRDSDRYRINAGFHTPINNSVDFVAEAGYENIDQDLDVDDSGFNALAGFRGMASQNIELGGYAQYSDVLESTDVTVEGRYHFNNKFSVGVEIGHDDELEDHIGANFRYNF
ncbi:hypothetical protein [Kangiella shandongensis]|uniref:hypothetical protein n=1 Tax=Kangiella shandongensis TaxID=2763258 RepID=UPI001CC00B4B|nr:hypothetical protein [Kangiella shandongensis]